MNEPTRQAGTEHTRQGGMLWSRVALPARKLVMWARIVRQRVGKLFVIVSTISADRNQPDTSGFVQSGEAPDLPSAVELREELIVDVKSQANASGHGVVGVERVGPT